MNKKIKLIAKLMLVIIFFYIVIKINDLNLNNENIGVNKDKCLICNSSMYENTNFVKLRIDSIGILYINSGTIDGFRLYELDENGNKIDFYGYVSKTQASNLKKGSSGITITTLDEMKAHSSIKLGIKHSPILKYMSSLYCQEHINEIIDISSGLDIVLLDFQDKKIYSLKDINSTFNIRNYNITINYSENNKNIDIDVSYNN